MLIKGLGEDEFEFQDKVYIKCPYHINVIKFLINKLIKGAWEVKEMMRIWILRKYKIAHTIYNNIM